MNFNPAIFEFIGKVIVLGGGATGISFLVFRFLGKSWIECKFAEKLEAYKYAQNKELEEVKYQINKLFDRATKLSEKEFQVLPEAWEKLNETLGAVSRLTSLFQQFPDLDKMPEDVLNEFLDKSRLTETEKIRIKDIPKKNEMYQDVIFWHDYNDVRNIFSDFHNYIQKNSIFLRKDLKNSFIIIDNLMWSAIIDREIGKQHGDHNLWVKSYQSVAEKIFPEKAKIEKMVEDRLCNSELL